MLPQDQSEDIKVVADYVSQLRRVGKGHGELLCACEECVDEPCRSTVAGLASYIPPPTLSTRCCPCFPRCPPCYYPVQAPGPLTTSCTSARCTPEPRRRDCSHDGLARRRRRLQRAAEAAPTGLAALLQPTRTLLSALVIANVNGDGGARCICCRTVSSDYAAGSAAPQLPTAPSWASLSSPTIPPTLSFPLCTNYSAIGAT